MAEHLSENVLIFNGPLENKGIQTKEWIDYRPTNQLTEGAAIEFNLPPFSSAYVDLKNSRLHLKLKISKSDNTPISESDNVGLINLALHSIFSQVDLQLQQQAVTSLGPNYPYKAIFDAILNTNENTQKCRLTSQLFYKDNSFEIDEADVNGSNSGLYQRSQFTAQGQEVDLCGPLFLDMCQQSRYILNGVPIHLKLWPHKDAFRLMSNVENANYKVHVTDALFRVCLVKVNPGVMIGQSKTLQQHNAVYPYSKSSIKTFSLASGMFGFNSTNLFENQIPSQVIIGLVSASAFSGNYKKNPFNFQHYNCSYINFTVDAQSVPGRALQPNYGSHLNMDAYSYLIENYPDIAVNRQEFTRGYCLYVINCNGFDTSEVKKGLTQLELKFSEPLPEPCVVIVYGKFPSILQINESRSVLMSQ